ncbi:MAG: hypothetical protein V3T24_06195 [Longimicrobiales bacterium]
MTRLPSQHQPPEPKPANPSPSDLHVPAGGRVVTGPDGEQAVMMSEEQFMADLLREDRTLPALILAVCGGLALLILAWKLMPQAGVEGAIGAGFLLGIFFGVAVAAGTAAAWCVAKIFGEDFGTTGSLMLRIAAVTAAELLIYVVLLGVISPIVILLIGLPILLGLMMWLVGMNLFQAFVFSVILKMIEWLLATIGILILASATM